MTDSELLAARARAAAARADLQATVRELQARLRPSSLASDALDGIKRKSEDMAEDAVDAVRKRPVAASAVVAGIGALIGARLYFRKSNEGDPS
ncbi:DUF3618 domain-containing protein [Sphingomonas sp. BIUV-7]|uniref:DUF3618 domain-containing protein n=1 Tax=Sphingomonas natans TaxID=3063330 RepID=A0ABT8Y8W4_9SPHN|nr:DUF3618 domain-containing protein [Sphingomonas sp. BIUV-7]MDO6414759.1 DUF3618 domain-containing protein [Sphingomonas sp. BIUV-7]